MAIANDPEPFQKFLTFTLDSVKVDENKIINKILFGFTTMLSLSMIVTDMNLDESEYIFWDGLKQVYFFSFFSINFEFGDRGAGFKNIRQTLPFLKYVNHLIHPTDVRSIFIIHFYFYYGIHQKRRSSFYLQLRTFVKANSCFYEI